MKLPRKYRGIALLISQLISLGQFRFGVTYNEIRHFHPKLKRLFSFSNATTADLRAFNKRQAVLKWRQHDLDTGSDAIQIDILTQRIRTLRRHLQQNKQDKRNGRNLQLMLRRRKGLILHLKKHNVPLYYQVLREIKLPDNYELYVKDIARKVEKIK